MAHPTPSQLVVIEITERLSSVISLLATTFIIVTFLTSRAFRKPINRIVFYVSFSNIITTVPTLISTAGIHAGPNSALCQMQGFLIQW
jgi:prephenate dehydratase